MRFDLGTALLCSLLALACSPKQLGCEAREQAEEVVIEETEAPLTPAHGAGDSVIEHQLSFPARTRHQLHVESVFLAPADALEIEMAVWTPGSYLVREYARHVEGLSASTLEGAPLRVEKVAKNRWIIETEGEAIDRVVLRYDLYARELSVRTNFVDADIAVLNGAPTFFAPAGAPALSHEITLTLPDEWDTCHSALQPGDAPEGTARFRALHFHELVDSPIVCGSARRSDFEVEGIAHSLLTFGDHGAFDQARAAEDVQRLVETQIAFWHQIPYPRYTFLNLLLEGSGGLEHRASSMVLASRWDSAHPARYRGWLSLLSHEFFHTWNVKALRPRELEDFDYNAENYTRALWIVEGITSYYDELLVRRAGLMSDSDYLAQLSDAIATLQATPGRLVQSLSDASFDAWIRFYRPDENSPNVSVSYYRKGALVAWLLDAEIRKRSHYARSLDDVMRLLYARHHGEGGFTREEFEAIAAEVAGEELSAFFATTIDSTQELDFQPALDTFGLRFEEPSQEARDEPTVDLGIELSGGVITFVARESAAEEAGLNVGDEILAFGQERLTRFDDALSLLTPGEEVQVLIARRRRLRELSLVPRAQDPRTWRLRIRTDLTRNQQVSLRSWLDG